METDAMHLDALTFNVDAAHAVSGLLRVPANAVACYVVAHGAGAGMTHPFMAAVADGLAERRSASRKESASMR